MARSKKQIIKETYVSSLSSDTSILSDTQGVSLNEIRESVFDSINNSELQKALDSWLKNNLREGKIARRDLNILKSMITEYMDTFILFGYNLQNERVIIQHFSNSKDRDAIMEFLKTIFLKQQNENFLDMGGNDDD